MVRGGGRGRHIRAENSCQKTCEEREREVFERKRVRHTESTDLDVDSGLRVLTDVWRHHRAAGEPQRGVTLLSAQ